MKAPTRRRLRRCAWVIGAVLLFTASELAPEACARTARPLALPGFVLVTRAPSGSGLYQGVFPSTRAPQPLRPGFVYLPPGFETARPYPVVYLLHGMPGSPSEYVDSLRLQTLADRLIASGTVRPFIAVVPAAGQDPHYNGEWAGPWEDYVVRDIVPWVDAHLPTERRASGRTIAGLSAGGFGAALIGLHSPTVFGRIESWSGYFHPLHDGPFRDAAWPELAASDAFLLAAKQVRLLHASGTRFFLGSGPSHSHWFKEQQTITFAQLLRRLRIPVKLQLVASGKGQYATLLDAGLSWALPARRHIHT